jgi:conjugal transfer pilus assembly protein TraV
MNRLWIAASLTSLLSACAVGHVDYDCHLADVQAAKCASMEDAYKASRTYNRASKGHAQSVFEDTARADKKDGATSARSDEQPFFRGEESQYPDAAQQGMPVFKQPKVMRVWVAPYVDADGNLRSGEYAYFATPGEWNYGSLNKPGAASGMFQPTRPGQLGFNPTDKRQAQTSQGSASPAKPPEAPAQEFKPTIPAAATGGAAAAPAAATQGGITQPYQRLSN